MRRRLFVTTALPYANGPFHIGHIMEYIQADIWVRFQRMQGHEVHFIGADDAHGAPIMLAAEKAGKPPEQFIAEIAAGRKQYLDGFHIEFDNWHSTHSKENTELSQDIYRKLDGARLVYKKAVEQFFDPVKGMFLADRYIKGECPNCGTKDQYGDRKSTRLNSSHRCISYAVFCLKKKKKKPKKKLFIQSHRPPHQAAVSPPAPAESSPPARAESTVQPSSPAPCAFAGTIALRART